MSTLSDRLRAAMKDAGVTQTELARRCGVSQPSVAGWLSGKAKFLRGENLLAAAAALNVSDEWLATGRGPRERGAARVAEDSPAAYGRAAQSSDLTEAELQLLATYRKASPQLQEVIRAQAEQVAKLARNPPGKRSR